MAPSDFLIVFSHELSLSTLATQTASTGNIVKAASLIPLPSIANKVQVMLDLIDLVRQRSQPFLHTSGNWRRK